MEARKVVHGYVIANEQGEIAPFTFTRRALLPFDVQISLKYCGICHSDIHHCYNEWRDSIYPMVTGHEMTGIVSVIGTNVTKFKPGDKVAVGNLVNSCRICEQCKIGNEQYCENGGPSWVYNGHDRNWLGFMNGRPQFETEPHGELTLGGYYDMIIVNEDFVLRIPASMDLQTTTPLLCAGITVFNPLIQFGVGPSHNVAVAGIGGLGHLAIKMAHALGAKVTAITRTHWKLQDSERLGAQAAILSTDEAEMKRSKGSFDLIIDTIPHPHPLDPYLNLLKVNGVLWILGVLEPFPLVKGVREGQLTKLPPFNGKLITNYNRSIKGSNVGGIPLMQQMLNFCAENDIGADIELITIDSTREAFDRVRSSKVRYRFVIDLGTITP